MADDLKTTTNNVHDTKTWPELGMSLYDKLTGRGSEITYEFDDFEVLVPSRAGANAEHARWKVNGALRIRTRDQAAGE